MRRPLLFMRKRSLLGSILGRHAGAGFTGLSKSIGSFNDPAIGRVITDPLTGESITDPLNNEFITQP